jgi:hypothetical protein
MKQNLSQISEQDLIDELKRRKPARQFENMSQFEESVETRIFNETQVELEEYLTDCSNAEDSTPKRCPQCGASCRVRRKKVARWVRSTMGEHRFSRNYHFCDVCKKGFYPLDIELGLAESGELTPRMERRVLDLALNSPFDEAAERWSIHHHGKISENLARRVVERTGQKLESTNEQDLYHELNISKKRSPKVLVWEADGSMVPCRGEDSWREIKLGIIYDNADRIQVKKRKTLDEPTYVAGMGIGEFRASMSSALKSRGSEQAESLVVVGDGAPWIWNFAEDECPDAIQILDWFHAIEHGSDCGKIVLENDPHVLPLWRQRISDLLWSGQIRQLLTELEQCCFLSNKAGQESLIELKSYYSNNQKRMRYARFEAQGFPIGSGVIESAHRHVLQKRLKLAGQHWNPERAVRLAKLRAAQATCGPKAVYQAIGQAKNISVELKRCYG